MGSQQESEISVQLWGYDLTGITKRWWDSSHNWSAAVEGYGLFRKGRMRQRGGGGALSVTKRKQIRPSPNNWKKPHLFSQALVLMGDGNFDACKW